MQGDTLDGAEAERLVPGRLRGLGERVIGERGVYRNPILPDFMVFLNMKELPLVWWGFQSFPYAMLMVLLVPGLLAFGRRTDVVALGVIGVLAEVLLVLGSHDAALGHWLVGPHSAWLCLAGL